MADESNPMDPIIEVGDKAIEASRNPGSVPPLPPPPPPPPPPISAPPISPGPPEPTPGDMFEARQRETTDELEEMSRRHGCGTTPRMLAAMGVLAVLIAVAAAYVLLGGDDDGKSKSTGAPAPAQEQSPTTSSDPNAPISPPDPSTLPPGAVLYQGSAGPIGCVPCDGKFRLLHPTNGGVVADKLGGPAEASQAMAFPTNGTITEFGINLTNADGGKWEFALHANGNTYVASCHIAVGSTRCKTKGVDNAPIKAGDKIAVIVGNPGDPLTQGAFSASWWIVFQSS